MINIEELSKATRAATPGPWEVESARNEGDYGSGEEAGTGFDSFKIVSGLSGLVLFDSLGSDAVMVDVADNGCAYDMTALQNARFIEAANPANVLELLGIVENLVVMTQRLARELNKVNPGYGHPNLLSHEAMGYLGRSNLIGSPLREGLE